MAWRTFVSTLSLVYTNLTVIPNQDVFHIVVMSLCLLFCKTSKETARSVVRVGSGADRETGTEPSG